MRGNYGKKDFENADTKAPEGELEFLFEAILFSPFMKLKGGVK